MAKRNMSRLCLLVAAIFVATVTVSPVLPGAMPDKHNYPPGRGEQFGAAVHRADRFTLGTGGYMKPLSNVNGAIKCQQISGGDGYATMGDGTQTYLFAFGPLSGLADIAKGLPGTQPPSVFNTPFSGTLAPGDPATSDGASSSPYAAGNLGSFTYNGAIGQVPDADCMAEASCAAKISPLVLTGMSIRARSWTSAS